MVVRRGREVQLHEDALHMRLDRLRAQEEALGRCHGDYDSHGISLTIRVPPPAGLSIRSPGVGGARPVNGSGLSGLADRVERSAGGLGLW